MTTRATMSGTEEHEFDFAGDPFNSILEPDELIDTLGSYAVIPPDLREQLIADRDAGYLSADPDGAPARPGRFSHDCRQGG